MTTVKLILGGRIFGPGLQKSSKTGPLWQVETANFFTTAIVVPFPGLAHKATATPILDFRHTWFSMDYDSKNLKITFIFVLIITGDVVFLMRFDFELEFVLRYGNKRTTKPNTVFPLIVAPGA